MHGCYHQKITVQSTPACHYCHLPKQYLRPSSLRPVSYSRKQLWIRPDPHHRLMAHASDGQRVTPAANAADAVEGGIAQSLGNFFFRSRNSGWLYNTSVSAPFRLVRLAAMTLIAWILLGRSWRLFARPSFESTFVLLLLSAASWQFGLVRTLLFSIAALSLTMAKQLASTPEVNAGHRAGGKGFQGEHVENTLEALSVLIDKDNSTPAGLPNLAYIEFDVHETQDGELVVLHDLHSVLAASQGHAINSSIMQELADQGLQLEAPSTSAKGRLLQKVRAAGRGLYGDTAGMQKLTAAQLQQIHISGKQGMHVPTLEEFLRCCDEHKAQRSIAVEVKSIVTDAGRTKFIKLLRDYKVAFDQRQDPWMASRLYKPFAPIAAISFPFFWAESFGEFGSDAWYLWGFQFRETGLQTRSCMWHNLNLTRGLD